MPFMLVTCPETAHLELIAYDDDPLGTLIEACSRFEPTCALGCPRTCAARLDRRTRGTGPTDVYDLLDVGDTTNLGLDLARMERAMHGT